MAVLEAVQLTLSSIVHYAQSLPEYPQDQLVFKKKHQGWHDFARRIMQRLGFNKNYLVRPQEFKQLLQEVTEQRMLRYVGGKLVEKMVPKVATKYIIWGPLNGSFHSLVRDIQEISKLGYIDQNLRIAQEDIYFVFNGDLIGQSPYNVQTYALVLYLMKQNPKQVMYIKGGNENKDSWIDSPFNDQLYLQLNIRINEQQEILTLLNNFFNSLPLAFYLIAPDQREKKVKQLLRISYMHPDDIELQEQEFSYFFDMYAEPIVSLMRTVKKESDISVHVASYVYAQDNKNEFVITQGLLLRAKDKLATHWIVTSSPTAQFRRQYQFFNDAFVILQTSADLSGWKFTLYYQDVRTMRGFKQDQSWYVRSGERAYDPLQSKIAELENKLHAIRQHNNSMLRKCELPAQPENVLQLMHNTTLQKLLFFYNHVLCAHVLSPLYTIKI